MDRGARPPDVSADTSIFGRDRRRTRRHRVHTPAYASLTGSAQGAGLELSEILDISETGMCIQSSSLMKVNRLLPLCLDLSETGARIHVIGHVVWSELSGRTGIRFPEMSDASRKQLIEWLEANAKAETTLNVSLLPSSGSDPAMAQARFNAATLLLLAGDYEKGWEEYEWRWQLAELKGLYIQKLSVN